MQQLSSIQKATEVLFFLNAQPGPCGVSRIAQALAMPKASAHRLLTELRFRNLVRRDERGQYGLGVGLVALGLGASRSEPLTRVARPILQQAAARLGETFFLVSQKAGELVVLDKAEGSGFLRVSPQVGARVPVHATAVGRLYMAFAPDQVHVDEQLTPFTPNTPATVEKLREAVATVRERGVSSSHEEWVAGLSALAAPITLAGRLLGSVVVACVAPRYSELGPRRLGSAAKAAAEQVTQQLEESS